MLVEGNIFCSLKVTLWGIKKVIDRVHSNPTAYWHKNRYTNWHMNRHTNRYTEYLPTQVNKNNIWHSKSVYQLAHHWHKNRYTDSCTDWCASWYTDSCAKYYFYLLELVNIRYTDSCADSCASWYTNSCAKGRRGVTGGLIEIFNKLKCINKKKVCMNTFIWNSRNKENCICFKL